MIFYFSGTGNSRYIARRIAETTGEELIDLNEKIRQKDTSGIKTGERLIFVTPTYAWQIPHTVEQWIRNTGFADGQKAWFVMTCGDEIGNAGKYNRSLCAEKHWNYMGTAQIVMPENYIAMFQVPKPSTALKIIQNAEPSIVAAAETIDKGQKFSEPRITFIDRLKSGMVNRAFYSMGVKAGPFRVTEACIRCGHCATLCPLNNIHLADGKPVWDKNCTHCMACICCCPVEAIEYGRKSVGKPRYHCDL